MPNPEGPPKRQQKCREQADWSHLVVGDKHSFILQGITSTALFLWRPVFPPRPPLSITVRFDYFRDFRAVFKLISQFDLWHGF